MKLLKNKKGFTLLELLIVIVVLGVIAGLMFPVLTTQIEKNRAQEALGVMGAVRNALTGYFQDNNTYVGATLANIGYNPNVAAPGGQAPNFSYALGGLGAAAYTITATPNPGGAYRAGLANTDNITIDQAGAVVRSGAYA